MAPPERHAPGTGKMPGPPCPAHAEKASFPMAAFDTEKVLTVHHWNDSLFTFTTTRATSLRFESGHFVMVGIEVDGKPLMRAYSIASAHYEEHLEFFSIKVPNGPLTSRLQHLKVGDPVLIGRKPTGTLVLTDLLPGRNLYLFSTGTGLAPFMSIIRDPDVYDRFEKVVLVHGVRKVDELAYAGLIAEDLPQHDHLGEQIRAQLIYYPTVTREPFRNQGRLPELIDNGKLCADVGLPQIDPAHDRAMICGGPAMLKDTRSVLDAHGFVVSAGIGQAGHYVIERAFVEK
jgi:ferredoxin--NADP+ reductase